MPEDCQSCLDSPGKLCPIHAREILPQLAVNRRWLLMMGVVRTEQRRRQSAPADTTERERIARRNARKASKASHRGPRALLAALANG